MNNDIRISTHVMSHPKIKKLIRRLGSDGFVSLVSLWSYVAVNHPSGDLSALDSEDIELAANWNNEPGLFFISICDLGLLDCEEGSTRVHNWVKHNPYVVGAEERHLKARKSRLCRYGYEVLPSAKHGAFKRFVFDSLELCENTTFQKAIKLFLNFTTSTTPIPLPVPKPKEGAQVPSAYAEKASVDDTATKGSGSRSSNALSLIGDDLTRLKDYLKRCGAYAFSRLEGLVKEFQVVKLAYGFSEKDCIDCMIHHKWRGFKADWVKTCAYFKERIAHAEANKVNAIARKEIERTKDYLANLDKPRPTTKRQWLLDETHALLFEKKINQEQRAAIVAGRLSIDGFTSARPPVGVV